MANLDLWKEYFALRKERGSKIKELVKEHRINGDPGQICEKILDIFEHIPASLDTTVIDLFKIIYTCVKGEKRIFIRESRKEFPIEGKERIKKLTSIIEEDFIREINKPHNMPYFIGIARYLKWEHDGTQIVPSKIISQTQNPVRGSLNTEEYNVYDENDNKLELAGVDHERVDKILLKMESFEKEGNRYYIPHLLNTWRNTLRNEQIFDPSTKFLCMQEANFLYNLLPVFNLYLDSAITAKQKNDSIRKEIYKVNSSVK